MQGVGLRQNTNIEAAVSLIADRVRQTDACEP